MLTAKQLQTKHRAIWEDAAHHIHRGCAVPLTSARFVPMVTQRANELLASEARRADAIGEEDDEEFADAEDEDSADADAEDSEEDDEASPPKKRSRKKAKPAMPPGQGESSTLHGPWLQTRAAAAFHRGALSGFAETASPEDRDVVQASKQFLKTIGVKR